MKTIISFLVFLMMSFSVFADQTKTVKMDYYLTAKNYIVFYSASPLGAAGCPNATRLIIIDLPLVQSGAISGHLSGFRLASSGKCHQSENGTWYFRAQSVWAKE